MGLKTPPLFLSLIWRQNMNQEQSEQIYQRIYKALMILGITGPFYIGSIIFDFKNPILRYITFLVYIIMLCVWLKYIWALWLPISVVFSFMQMYMELKVKEISSTE